MEKEEREELIREVARQAIRRTVASERELIRLVARKRFGESPYDVADIDRFMEWLDSAVEEAEEEVRKGRRL